MKIIVMGGAGDVGSRAVEEFVLSDGVELVTIADRNTAAANELAQRVRGKGAKVEVVEVDANDHAGLVAAMRGHNVAASALGPFFMFESKLVRAAIEAGVDYASVCDEWDAVEEIMKKHDGDARKNNRIILSCLGTSPGITSVGVRYLADKMDRPRRADICVYQPLDIVGGEAVLRHVFFIMTGKIATWRDGVQKMIPACSEMKRIEFPQFGKIKVWNMGHGEPVSVPRFIPGIEEVNFYMGYGKGAELFVWPAKAGLFRNKNITEFTVKLLTKIEDTVGLNEEPAPGAVRMDVWGEKDGGEVHYTMCGIGQMREATGVSLAVGALMLGRKQLTTLKGGVYTPEGCIDPGLFFADMKEKGIEAYLDMKMTKPV